MRRWTSGCLASCSAPGCRAQGGLGVAVGQVAIRNR
jgi:hypothetical protein